MQQFIRERSVPSEYWRTHRSEIMLPNNDKWSFVCNLSSMNLERFDDWKDTDAVETMVYFLDAVMTEFISDLERMRDSNKREERQSFVHMERAYNFAKANRALGLGALGWHSYLQSKMIPFESVEANKLNARIFALIQRRSYKASEELAEMFGEPEVLRSEEHTSELQSRGHLVCRLLLEKKKQT